MKLVDAPAEKLGEEGGKWLHSLIDASLKKDRDYYKFMGNLRNLLSGKHWRNVRGATNKKEIQMVVNLSHAHVRTLVPTLFFQNPSADCAPTAPQHSGKEQTWNGIINNTLDKIDFATEAKAVVLDAVLYPEGVMKHVVNKPDTKPTSESGSSGPTVWLTKGSPVHVRIAPVQLIVDYLVADRDINKARYIAIRYKRPLHELKKHPIYGKNIKKDSKVTKTPTTGNMVNYNPQDVWEDWETKDKKDIGDTGEELVTIYEVWIHQLISPYDDKVQIYQQMCVLLEDQNEPIRELTPWTEVMGEGFDQYPIDQLILLPVPDAPASSELGVWQDMQMALNWLISRVTELVENDRLLYGVDPTGVKNYPAFKEKFYKGRSRELFEVMDGRNPADVMSIVQPTFVGRDNYALVDLVTRFIQQVGGIGINRRGSAGIRTATEASIIDKGIELKTDEKVDTVAKFLKRVLIKNTMMTRSLVKTDLGVQWVFRIGGEVGSVKWVNFTAEDINWLPEVRIRVNSFRKMDSLQEMQKYMGLINIALQLFKIYGPVVRVDILFAQLLEMAGIYDSGKIIGDQDKQKMLASIELAGMLAGVPTPVLESHNHAAHLQVDEAFKQSEYGQQIMASSPEFAMALAEHDQLHMMHLEAAAKKAQQVTAQQDPFSAAGMSEDAGNEQSEANDLTAMDRTAVSPTPGGNGEMS